MPATQTHLQQVLNYLKQGNKVLPAQAQAMPPRFQPTARPMMPVPVGPTMPQANPPLGMVK